MSHAWWLIGTCLLVLLALFGLRMAAARANRVFWIEVRSSRLLEGGGHLPAGLVDDFARAVSEQGVTEGRIECRLEYGELRLLVFGRVSRDTAQILRNILGTWPRRRLLSVPRRSRVVW